MTKAEKSIEIKVSSEKVWEMLAFDRLPEWGEGFGGGLGERVEYTSELQTPKDKYRVGVTAQGTPNTPFKDPQYHICRFKIIESMENKKLKYYALEKPKYYGTLDMYVTYSLESMISETKLTYELESGLPWGIFGKFLEILFARRMVEKNIEKALENLKKILEENV
ncbi:MAG: hypothetical protein AC479_06755 [miscellaneous Crenarchaeota group-6 archaeon AD8-1]|nr:MAG: hypothetical protein AC479_06755 [miscellaneous Crenarchaeota group-6 archaeon AD8-1]